MKRRSIRASIRSGMLVGALALSGLAVGSAPVDAQTNPYQRGPTPTVSSLTASAGPFAVSTSSVGLGASGFGGGTVYYPTDTSQGTFGGVVLAPGFTATSGTYAGTARRVASHGFVVVAIDTNSTLDFPDSRGTQIIAALNWLTGSSPTAVRRRVDASRLAVSGHSMGGGGTLRAANDRPSLKAAVALQPWHTTTNWSGVRVPTMIIGAESDTVAGVSSHSEPFYVSMTNAPEKAYVELRGESHFAGNANPADQGRAMVAWLKRFVDDDTRYEQFICPPPTGTDYSEWRNTCPSSGGGGGTPPTTTPPAEQCEWWEWWCTGSAGTNALRSALVGQS